MLFTLLIGFTERGCLNLILILKYSLSLFRVGLLNLKSKYKYKAEFTKTELNKGSKTKAYDYAILCRFYAGTI